MSVQTSFFHVDFSGYVQNISPLKKAKKDANLKYFNYHMLCKDVTYGGVCYRPDLHNKLIDTSQSKSPVKIASARIKKNLFNEEDMDIVISRKATV